MFKYSVSDLMLFWLQTDDIFRKWELDKGINYLHPEIKNDRSSEQ